MTQVVFASEKPARLVIEVARKEITEATVLQPENDGAPIDGV
jgi:hypothetical protein